MMLPTGGGFWRWACFREAGAYGEGRTVGQFDDHRTQPAGMTALPAEVFGHAAFPSR